MRIKAQSEILSDAIDYTGSITSQITDFTVGSALRSIYDAFSIELESFYILTDANIKEGIEKGLMQAFDFTPKDAVYAYGNLTLEFYTKLDSDYLIAKGTRFYTSDAETAVYYETTEAYVAQAGVSAISIVVQANQAGASANVSANEINTADASLINVRQVYNPSDILTGTDGESYADTKERFRLFIRSIGRATVDAIHYGALSVKEIASVFVQEEIGVVYVYAGDKNGELSQELAKKVEDALEDYRPAGIELKVFPMVKTNLDISINLILNDKSKYTVEEDTALNRMLRNYLNSFKADQNFIIHDMVRTILDFDDENIYDVEVTSATSNYVVAPDEIIRAGKITVTTKQKEDDQSDTWL